MAPTYAIDCVPAHTATSFLRDHMHCALTHRRHPTSTLGSAVVAVRYRAAVKLFKVAMGLFELGKANRPVTLIWWGLRSEERR
jgi:hypothetical protein